MEGKLDDVRLPFSVMDPLMGDVFSVLWEPEMMGDTGNILKILTSEVLSQVGQQVLQATIMTALMSALQWPFRKSAQRVFVEGGFADLNAGLIQYSQSSVISSTTLGRTRSIELGQPERSSQISS